jgi:hypothetical protein
VHVVGVLVQQESKIGGRLMGRSDGQEHVLLCFGCAAVQYRRKTRACRLLDDF